MIAFANLHGFDFPDINAFLKPKEFSIVGEELTRAGTTHPGCISAVSIDFRNIACTNSDKVIEIFFKENRKITV
jgi:hypothetical protein